MDERTRPITAAGADFKLHGALMQAALDHDADRKVAVLTNYINRTASLFSSTRPSRLTLQRRRARRARLNKVVTHPAALQSSGAVPRAEAANVTAISTV